MAEEKNITLKFLVDRKTNKVLYAEAKKDFVDFLFGLLQIPIGSIISLFQESNQSTPGSFGRVLESVLKMEATYFHSHTHKDNILNPTLVASSSDQTQHNPPLMLQKFTNFEQIKISGGTSNYSRCHYCGSSPCTSREPQLGYVKDSFIYMVTDDLKVSPMSTISLFSVLNAFGVKDIGTLEEKTVDINLQMGLQLVKACLESDSVLTDAFLGRE